MSIFDATQCSLGEGPMWHPTRKQLFWFDILESRLYTRTAAGQRHWQFGEMVSAAGWVDDETLLIASERALFRFDLGTGARSDVVALEADNPLTRSNDGRADPQGGFWIGTMAKGNPASDGAIYRYHRGTLRLLYPKISIPNSICFTPDGRYAHFTDTETQQVMKVALDADGWPVGAPQVWLDLRSDGLYPDGAVVDEAGTFWVAQWGAYRVAAYDTAGRFVSAVTFGAKQTSCPSFGGDDMGTLYCTSATKTLSAAEMAQHPDNGKVFAASPGARGQAEHRVIL